MSNAAAFQSNDELDAIILGHERRTGDRLDGPSPFKFTLAADVELEPKRYLVDGFVGTGEMSAWYGAPDSGKSCVAVDFACHVAADKEWCGRQVVQGAVLYVAAERGAVVKRRVVAWCSHHQIGDVPLAVVGESVNLRDGQGDADRIIATAQSLFETVNEPVVLIVVETLNRVLAGGDENSSKDMGAVIANIDRIQRATAAHVAIVHHVPVDRTDRMRGHSSVLGAVDLTVRITKNEKTVTIEADKANDLVERPRHAFQFKSVELLRDEETDQVTTAPVLESTEALPKGKSSGGWTRSLTLVRECIASALAESGFVHRVASDGPSVKAVFTDDARMIHQQRFVNGGEGDRAVAQRQAWRRGITAARN